MQYNQLSESNLNVSEICLGTMTYGQQNTIEDAHQQLDYAITQGVNFIDAAEMYPVPARAETQGSTESYIGEWLKKQQRDQLIIA
ncbi:MAG: aldo/keto reductase, partial [Coleofasciculaceae cyanobacterium]